MHQFDNNEAQIHKYNHLTHKQMGKFEKFFTNQIQKLSEPISYDIRTELNWPKTSIPGRIR